MFAELEALVALAGTGSMERAAVQLYVTPSALTRRIQRLEAELGLVLVDRRSKPPKLTQAGLEVLEKSRSILSSLGDLKASATGNEAPGGPFRLGLSHALVRPEISKVIIELGRRFPLLQPSLCNDVSRQLLARVRLGELDGALLILPAEIATPNDLESVVLSRETMHVVQARARKRRKSPHGEKFYRRSWVLNPAGCLVRDEMRNRVERLGAPFTIAAELHSPDLQLSLIAGDVGVGIMPASFLRTHPLRGEVSIIEDSAFTIAVRVVYCRGTALGARGRVALELQRILLERFGRIDAKRKFR